MVCRILKGHSIPISFGGKTTSIVYGLLLFTSKSCSGKEIGTEFELEKCMKSWVGCKR